MMRDLVLGLEAVLADGTILTSLNRMQKNNAGYDLKQLFIGTEGTLGVVTRAVLRLFPKPSSTQTALCALEDYGGIVRLLSAAKRRLGADLAAFEVMWPDFCVRLADVEPQPQQEIDTVVYDCVGEYAGSISAEHGIGVVKRAFLGKSRTAAEITTMRLLKRALDPESILNPGKIFT